MKRRIISSILSIAMIISLFTVAFVNPVGAAAEELTQYAKDRAALKAAIRELYLKGPEIRNFKDDFIAYGIFTDADKDADGKYVIEETRKDFVAKLTATPTLTNYFVKDTNRFLNAIGTKAYITGKVGWDVSKTDYTDAQLIVENIENVLDYASAVYYFGQNEDDKNVDVSFNEGRNAVVKEATGFVNAVLTALKAEVGAFSTSAASKPAQYEAIYNGVDYKGFLTAAYKYHASLGINPFYNAGSADSSNPFAAYYDTGFYTTIAGMTPVKWYTFEEIRANADWNKLLVAFEFELRKIHTATGAGVLYYDFINGEKATLNNSFDALCKAIVGPIFLDDQKFDMTKEIKAYLKLKKVVEIYNLYIKDLYNNIYTAPDMELLSNVLIAARFVEFIGADAYKVVALKSADIEGLANKIVASIEAFAPRADQAIDAASLAAGVKAIKDAKALVASYPETDGNKDDRNALIAAAKVLEDMLAVAANGKATISVAAGDKKMKDIYGTEIGNDKFSISFVPNYFAFLKYKALLDAATTTFVNNVNANSFGSGAYSSSRDNLKAILNQYGYLAGYVGTVVDGNVFVQSTRSALSAKYYNYTYDTTSLGFDGVVTSIFEKVVGYALDGYMNFDAGIDNAEYFYSTYQNAVSEYVSNNPTAPDGLFTDWESGTVTIKNGYDAAAADVKAALAFLTKDLTVYINTVIYNTQFITALFGLDGTANNVEYANSSANNLPEDGKDHLRAANYPTKYFENFVKAANAVKKITSRSVVVDSKIVYDRANFTKLLAAEKAFIAATKALLTNLGDARLDAYLADVQVASKVNYGNPSLDYGNLRDKLFNAGMDPKHYILTTTPRNYEYFAFTVRAVANWADATNYYAVDTTATSSRFDLNLYDPLVAAIGLTVGDASGFARDAVAKANALLQTGNTFASDIAAGLSGLRGSDPDVISLEIGTDMPLWYAQKLLADLQGLPAMLSANSTGAIAAKKAAVGGLNELLDKAAALNVYDYIVGENKDYDKVWEAFMAAYNAGVKVSYDKTVPLADIDEAVEALEKAMAALEDIKRPEDGEVITVEDFKDAIARAEAAIARYDLAEDLAVVNDLKELVNAANKLLTYNISVLTAGELKAEIEKLNKAIDAVLDAIYVGDALKADLEALAAGIDADKYTEESYNAAVKAYEAAMAVAESDTATVSECKAALESVKAAIDALVVKPVVVVSDTRKEAIATYDKAVEDYAGLVASEKYSAESLANLQAAIDALKAGIDSNASDAQLIDLIVKLRLANAALVVAPTHTSDD